MSVYQFKASTNEKWRSVSYLSVDDATWDQFGTKPLKPTWVPLVVETIDSDQDPEMDGGRRQYYSHLPVPDFPCNFGCENVISRRAVDVLTDFLEGPYEILPIKCNFGDYCAINVLKVVDAVDIDRSEVSRFSFPPHRVWNIHKYAWRNELIREAGIFCIPQMRLTVYCTEPVVQRIRDAGLTGFHDKPLPIAD